MYQFKYQSINPYDFYLPTELIFTCIVPSSWLALDLPILEEWVNYSDSLEKVGSCGPFVFKFFELDSSDKLLRIFGLDILHDGERCFENPIVIHAPNSMQSVELLLNHLLGFNAVSSWVGVDFSDLLEILKKSSTFHLRYGIGDSPSEILPNVLNSTADMSVQSEFLMIFCDNQKMRLEYISEAVEAMTSGSAGDPLMLVGASGVEQEQMLISVLIGQ